MNTKRRPWQRRSCSTNASNNRLVPVKLSQARAALSVPAPDPLILESVEAFMHRIDRHEWSRCPHCGKGQCYLSNTFKCQGFPDW